MSVELSPGESAEIANSANSANSAYALRLSTSMLDAAINAPKARDAFDLRGGVRLFGVTGLGATALKQRTGFGYLALGKGPRQGECLVSVRGTSNTSTTVIDSLARLLYSGALQSIRLAGMIRNLMLAAMRVMGRVVSVRVNITVDFVQYVLGLLLRFISTMALRAVETFSG